MNTLFDRRGAGTRACRDGTLPVARGRFCRARPLVLPRPSHESGFHGIVFNVTDDFFKLALVPYPVIVGFGLPKRLPGPSQDQVSLTRRATLERTKQMRRRNLRQQQRVDMVAHNHPSAQIVVANFDAALQGAHHNSSNILPAQVHRTESGGVQVAIHPDKRLPNSDSRRRISIVWQAAIQVPGYEQPLAFRVDVRQATAGFGHTGKWISAREILFSKFATARVPSRQARVPAPRAHE